MLHRSYMVVSNEQVCVFDDDIHNSSMFLICSQLWQWGNEKESGVWKIVSSQASHSDLKNFKESHKAFQFYD